jgi:DNA primase
MSAIDDVKQRLDIVQVISEYVNLQKSGRNFKALCPFHSEKTPSFFVFPERQSWHCFGACGTGGDIISFVIKKEGLDFGQALRLLANKAGVTLVTPTTLPKETINKERDKLFEINEAAAEYYHHLLLNTSAGRIARDYVAQRGLSSQTNNDFQLGYSPDTWEAIRQYLMDKGYGEEELIAAGLLIKREDGGSYDRFRNRLMFPIRDIQSHVIGFGARALDESLPKYLNSPQTLLFDKSNALYGIDRAQGAIRQRNSVIITEGYMDVIIAHQYGWENVVAFMGTAITEKQLDILKKLTSNLILALDADAAGQEAISRSGEMIERMLPVPPAVYASMKYDDAHNAEVKIIVLPPGKDPDEMIREDAAKWQELVTKAKPMINFVFDTIISEMDSGNAKDKSLAVEKLLPLLSEMKDPIRQAHYVERLARLLKIDDRALGDALKKFQISEKRRKMNRNVQSPAHITPLSSTSSPIEEYCLALLLQYPELKPESKKLIPDYFDSCDNRQLFQQWEQADKLDSIKDSLDFTLHEQLDNLTAKDFPPPIRDSEITRQKALYDCILRLQEKWLKSLEAKKKEILTVEAETGGITAQLAKLEEQGIEESKQLKEVFFKQSLAHKTMTSSKEE